MEGSSVHNSTSRLAGDAACKVIGSRRARILTLLDQLGPSTIFEIAAAMQLHDHQISGRFGELERDGMIRKTGDRRNKPETGCAAEVYALGDVAARAEGSDDEISEALGYPATLKIGNEGIFERLPVDPSLPGVPYALNSPGTGRQIYRVALVECEGCGKPLRLMMEGQIKVFRCLTAGCNRTWRPMFVSVPGEPEVLALVMTHL